MSRGYRRLRANAREQAKADAWNQVHYQGRAVTLRCDNGEILKATTGSEAFVPDGAPAVILLSGISSWYSLERLERVKPYFGTDEVPEYGIASGNCLCEKCGKLYFEHDPDLEHLGQHGIPFLTWLCDGRLVKL